MIRRIKQESNLAFPLRITANGGQKADRYEHIKQQVEQVIFTVPGERVHRPEFGAGVKALVFEPNGTPLWEITQKRLIATLSETLLGVVDPKTIRVDIRGIDASLIITIRYTLVADGTDQIDRYELRN